MSQNFFSDYVCLEFYMALISASLIFSINLWRFCLEFHWIISLSLTFDVTFPVPSHTPWILSFGPLNVCQAPWEYCSCFLFFLLVLYPWDLFLCMILSLNDSLSCALYQFHHPLQILLCLVFNVSISLQSFSSIFWNSSTALLILMDTYKAVWTRFWVDFLNSWMYLIPYDHQFFWIVRL